MKVVIVEDERLAAERLRMALHAYDPQIEVVAELQTVQSAIRWFDTHPAPHLVFLDVRLTDGLSFELFRHVRIAAPVIFTTAYDAYVLDAFECNSIDYLLKPIKAERLARAMQKYQELRRHFSDDLVDRLRVDATERRPSYAERLLVQNGTAYRSLPVDRLRYAYSDHKMTTLVDPTGARYLYDQALTVLEEVLDPARFFRLNRSWLAAAAAVASFERASRGRLRILLDPPVDEVVLVSQERAERFLGWMGR